MARTSAQSVPAEEPSDDLHARTVVLPPINRADHHGQGEMATRGRPCKGATSVQPSEKPGVVPVASRTEEVAGGGEGDQVTSPIGRRGADITAEDVDSLAMDEAGISLEPVVLIDPSGPPAEPATAVATTAPMRQGANRIRGVEYDS